jgi:hypothetical protein
MKLYHNGQLEGWQIPGKQDKRADRFDVPSSPAELAAWLNHRRVGPSGASAEHERQVEQLEEDQPQLASAGAVLTEADVGRVNDSRPSFLPRLSAEEIERHRVQLNKCPKCGNTAPNWLRLVIDGLGRATLDELEAAANAIRDHAQELGRRTDEGGAA